MKETDQLPKGAIMVGLDIGTTKISVIIGKKNQHGKLEILGSGRAISNGVRRGIVANIDKTVASIIYNPYDNLLFTSYSGKGSYCNDRQYLRSSKGRCGRD